ncbi:TRAP transporter substrate-binding protein DctP [Bacteriovorax sp. DB6_IX]|uniref:TRAP transporter substrate-binding protein DctP n=1 Tax=Bacteriovorax sp. DB6_IX TaxID=1353530 RepID=UPI000389E276|nr:TRAP transporter substrate-binding protein DctP [Bacteriovorax sp. DB6_IX]EQC43119.1 ABC transporter, substrate-binding protein, family 7 [Bacteriovorax sp. DB6_IX]
MAKEIKKATDKKVKIKFYFGGAQGDEPDVLRKIRVGQLHGGIFTGKALGEINGDVRVIELPFTFYHNRKKAWTTVEKMTPFFNQTFNQNKFENLGFFEIGNVYFVSQKETPSLDNLKGVKIWSWEGDELVATMIETMNLVSVPLPLPDVLSSLSTGIIDAAYAPPLGILSLQWNTKVKYLVDFPISFCVGAFLVGDKTWKKISPEHQKIVKEISQKYVKNVNMANAKDNVEAINALKSGGIKFLSFPQKDIERGKQLRTQIIGKLKGKLFSEKALKMLEAEL